MERFVLRCRSRHKVRLPLTKLEVDYLNRLTALLGHNDINFRNGISGSDSRKICRTIITAIEDGHIIESSSTEKKIPYVHNNIRDIPINFQTLSMESRQLLSNFIHFLENSTGAILEPIKVKVSYP